MIYAKVRIRSSLRHLRLRGASGTLVNVQRLAIQTSTNYLTTTLVTESLFKTAPASKIFQFLVKNHAQIDPQISLILTYNLLRQNNLQAAVSLQHLLLTNEQYRIPNELWNVFLDKVCCESSYFGAMLIFHELVDNHSFYDEVSFAVQENDQVPFIINPTTLVSLAKIFANNSDSKRLEGTLRYFRRFHSYLDERDAYKSLLVLNVEVYAQMGDFNQALAKFKNLAFSSRSLSSSNNATKVLPTAAHSFNQWRSSNLQSNQYRIDFIPTYPLDIHQQLLAQICQSRVFNPVVQYNVYSPWAPIIQTPITSSDLPRFQKLLTDYIKLEELYDYNKLIQFIRTSHLNLHIFIVTALCDLDKHELAYAVLKSFNSYGQLLCKSPAFVTLLKSTQNKPELAVLQTDIIKYYRSLNKGHLNYPVAAYA
ncbi:hypothetical protein KGF57_003518 [Candida theae]|uniref:Uncharacterized protein n=1 Tax=Candida theae TaxID=1198502 RepID=A0AAD5FXZ3_9ASCO|nr:uncharacterized protein KGF57_003518 [Candida theae]KAI5956032.1 hypothetical protein KGF57_003518 [Candida theae]